MENCKDTDGKPIKIGDKVKLEKDYIKNSGETIPSGTIFEVRDLFMDGTLGVICSLGELVVPSRRVKKI